MEKNDTAGTYTKDGIGADNGYSDGDAHHQRDHCIIVSREHAVEALEPPRAAAGQEIVCAKEERMAYENHSVVGDHASR